MCNKVDSSVKIFGCINARSALTFISIAWFVLGIIAVIFFVLVTYVLVKPKTEEEELAAGIAGIWVGLAAAVTPFTMSFLIGILLCFECVCIYVLAAIWGIMVAVYKVSQTIHEREKAHSTTDIVMTIVLFIVEFITLYAIIMLAFCGNQREDSGIDEEEKEESKSEIATV